MVFKYKDLLTPLRNRENVKSMGGTSNPSLQGRLDSVIQRLEKVEKRLDILEEAAKPVSKAKELRRKDLPPPSEDSSPNHNYLKRTIDDAKRRYEREYRA